MRRRLNGGTAALMALPCSPAMLLAEGEKCLGAGEHPWSVGRSRSETATQPPEAFFSV